MTVSHPTATKVLERDMFTCVICKHRYAHIHHRRPKRMGGSKALDTDTVVNLVCLCEPCHRTVHAHGVNGDGYLLSAMDNPAEVPLIWRGRWVTLTTDGDIEAVSRMNHPSAGILSASTKETP